MMRPVYLDNAATSFPKPRETIDALCRYQCGIGGNPGRSAHSRAREAAALVFDCRARLAALFDGQPENVIFTLNTTYAINLALKTILRPGDRLLLSDIEHNALFRPAYALQARGIGLDIFTVDLHDRAKTIENAAAAITPRTKMLACTACSNILPLRLPLIELGAICRDRGVLFLVDGAQAAGHFPISMEEASIDALCLPGHKGLLGVTGCGALLMSPRFAALAAEQPTLIEGGSGSRSDLPVMPLDFPDRMEGGTLPVLPIAALGGGLRYLFANRVRIARTEQFCYRTLRSILLSHPRVRLYLPEAEEGSLLLFNLEHTDCAEAAERFDRLGIGLRDGLHCAPLAHRKIGTAETGALRVSFGPFLTENDLDHFDLALHRIAGA